LHTVLAVLVLCTVVPVLADTSTGENLLQNPGFEASFAQYGPFGTAIVAEGWTPWWRPQGRADPVWQNRMPEYKAAAPYENRIHAGRNAQQLFTAYGTHVGGIYQVVGGVEPGSTVRFAVWGHAWAGGDDDPYRSQDGGPMHMAIGIDPAGGTSPFSPRVVWSQEQNPLDEWAQFEVEAVAVGSAVTVFTRSAPDYPTRHNDVYWDEARLIAIRPAPTPTATPRIFFAPPNVTPTAVPEVEDSPTAGHAEPAHPVMAPAFTPSPTPEQALARASTQTEPTATPAFTIPIISKICVTVFGDHNANRSQDDGEPAVAGARLVLSSSVLSFGTKDATEELVLGNEGQTVRELVTTNKREPACFADLAPSDPEESIYYLTVIAPPGYRTPASDTWQVRLGKQDAHILVGLRKAHKAMWNSMPAEGIPVVTDRAPHSLVPWITFLIAGGLLSIIGWSVLGQH
jgi:hypothetical protein